MAFLGLICASMHDSFKMCTGLASIGFWFVFVLPLYLLVGTLAVIAYIIDFIIQAIREG